MKPSIRQLEVLIAVAEARSISAAARNLRISQPAATRTLSDLEQSLKVKLFDRSAAGILPTVFGRKLLEYARSVLAELRQAEQDLEALRGGSVGTITVGTSPVGAVWLVPTAVGMLSESHAHAIVTVVHSDFQELLAGLRTGQIDVVVAPLSGDTNCAEFIEEELYRNSVSIFVHRTHPEATRVSANLSDLQKYPWIIPLPSTRLGALVLSMFKNSGLDLPSFRVHTESMAVVRSLLLSTGLPWVSVLASEYFRDRPDSDNIIALEFADPSYMRSIGFLLRRHRTRTLLIDALIGKLRQVAEEIQHATAHS